MKIKYLEERADDIRLTSMLFLLFISLVVLSVAKFSSLILFSEQINLYVNDSPFLFRDLL